MLSKSKCIAHFAAILDNAYPDTDEISDEVLKVIDLHIAKDISRRKNKKHKTLELKHFDGHTCDIDKNISELIDLIWQCKIDTYNSCEDNIPAGYMWIQFSTASDIQKFLNIVFDNVEEMIETEIFDRATNVAWPHEIPDSWIYDINLDDEDDFSISISLRFPQDDYEWICQRFRLHLMKIEN